MATSPGVYVAESADPRSAPGSWVVVPSTRRSKGGSPETAGCRDDKVFVEGVRTGDGRSVPMVMGVCTCITVGAALLSETFLGCWYSMVKVFVLH